ncbi:unnamed protein product [Meganyctiphanes norvegica]|uniref:Uncharacterized protein n=1 Tax=Meganyctiphanes norvegica TaxID=48144 RepID=A0AAV2RCE9_MEGNR
MAASVQHSAWWIITGTIALHTLTVTCIIPEQNNNKSSSIQAAQHDRSQHDIDAVVAATTSIPKHLAKPEQATDQVVDSSSEVHSDRNPFSEHSSSISDKTTSAIQSAFPLSHLKDPSNKRNISLLPPGAVASPLRHRDDSSSSRTYMRPSYLGTMLLLLITMVVSISLVVMFACFIAKWRDNMSTSRYPSVMYSMLRQGEDEPEDVLGEILINIGLAGPAEEQPTSESEEDSNHDDDQEVDVCNLDGSNFTTIPLQSGEETERSHLLAPQTQEESDEELLQ